MLLLIPLVPGEDGLRLDHISISVDPSGLAKQFAPALRDLLAEVLRIPIRWLCY